jgi:uroporphyrinogen decarboxylase
MTSRERVQLALSHREADRVAVQDLPWFSTVERWHREGLPAGMTPAQYFGYEFAAIEADATFQLPRQVLEETEETTVVKDANGSVFRNWKKQTSTPELMGFTITSRRSWEENRSRRTMNPTRIDREAAHATAAQARRDGKFILYNTGCIGYDFHSSVVGPETLLPALIEDPGWPKEMFEYDAALHIDIVEEMLAMGIELDAAYLSDDLGYRNGPFFSPDIYQELLFPSHRRLCDFFKSKKMPVFLHTCGQVSPLVPRLIEAGIDCLEPIEVKAGMDLVELKKSYGAALCFMGGIDVRAMAHPDPSVIEREISSKISFAKQGGGYIYHSDHSVPDNISFPQYCRVMALVEKYGAY